MFDFGLRDAPLSRIFLIKLFRMLEQSPRPLWAHSSKDHFVSNETPAEMTTASLSAMKLPELKALHGVLGDHIYDVNISSTKSMTGHLLGAAGAVEALACIFAINNGVIPPTINNENLDPRNRPPTQSDAQQGAEARCEVCDEQYVRFRRS